MLRSHVDWLLGDEVAKLRAMTPSGHESISLAWPVVLRNDLGVRKEAMRQPNMNGVNLATAFAAGRKSDALRTRCLVTPLAWAARHEDNKSEGQQSLSNQRTRVEQHPSHEAPEEAGLQTNRSVQQGQEERSQEAAHVPQRQINLLRLPEPWRMQTW